MKKNIIEVQGANVSSCWIDVVEKQLSDPNKKNVVIDIPPIGGIQPRLVIHQIEVDVKRSIWSYIF